MGRSNGFGAVVLFAMVSASMTLIFEGSANYHHVVANLTSLLHDDIGTLECENVCESLAQPYNLQANCTQTCVVLLKDYVHTSCGKNKTRPGIVTISAINTLKKPFFNATVRLPAMRVQPFIRYMEEASLVDKRFSFSVHHNLPYGYFVDTLNGVSGYWDTAAMNGTYWHIKVLPDRDFHLGVSSYFPRSGDHITLTLVNA